MRAFWKSPHLAAVAYGKNGDAISGKAWTGADPSGAMKWALKAQVYGSAAIGADGTVSDVKKLLLRVFGIFRGDLIGNVLFLLGERIACRHGNCHTQQCQGRQSEGGKSVHDVPPWFV